MRRLRAISAVFAAAAGFDAEQTAPLHFFPAPMLEMNFPALRNQIKQRLSVERVQLIEFHRAPRLNRERKFSHRLTRIFTDKNESGRQENRKRMVLRSCFPAFLINFLFRILIPKSEFQFTQRSFCETRTGSSSIMYWVLPTAPIMRVPVPRRQ